MRRRGPKGKLRHQRSGGKKSQSRRREDGHKQRRGGRRFQDEPRARRAKSKETFVGRVQKKAQGFGFVLPKVPGMKDAFLAPRDSALLLNDDVVEFSLIHDRGRTAARVHRVLKRGQTQVIGQIRRGREWKLQTLEGDWLFVIDPPRDLKPDEWVLARFAEYPSHEEAGSVTIDYILGPELLPKHDPLVAIARFNLPSEFSGNVRRETLELRRQARAAMENLSPSGRRDLRKKPLVTIDGVDAKDFDDAILVEAGDGKGNAAAFILYVAIADVSFFVRPDSLLDQSAIDRGTSVYFPGTVIPMLPEELSNDLCSLRPREERLALVAEIHYNWQAHVVKTDFYEAVIQTAARLTYEQVQLFFDGDRATTEELSFLKKPLETARALYVKLDERRKERGVLDFDLPECKIQLDPDGEPTGMGRAVHHDSHRLIEEFMIAANRAVAHELKKKNIPALYRVHEPPDEKSLQEINSLLKTLGISLPLKDLKPTSLAQLLEATAEIKGAATLHQFILRLQKQARYEPNPRGHFGLALADYAHFTSPIRRYPDLVVHRGLKQLIRTSTDEKIVLDGDTLERYEALGQETSDKERRAMNAERFILKRKQCWYMLNHIGETFEGNITGVVSSGVFLEIKGLGAEGFLPLERMPGFYEFDERKMCLRKRPGHGILALGDELTVVLDEVSVNQNQITFSEATKKQKNRDHRRAQPNEL